jgi:hypothetical protein
MDVLSRHPDVFVKPDNKEMTMPVCKMKSAMKKKPAVKKVKAKKK